MSRIRTSDTRTIRVHVGDDHSYVTVAELQEFTDRLHELGAPDDAHVYRITPALLNGYSTAPVALYVSYTPTEETPTRAPHLADQAPARGTDERQWWLAGARAEAKYRQDQRIPEHRQLYDYVDVLTSATQRPPDDTPARIAWLTFQLFALDDTPLRTRLRYAWHILRRSKYPTPHPTPRERGSAV